MLTYQDIDNITDLAIKASAISFKKQKSHDYKVYTKSDGSFVTSVDLKISAMLTDGLKNITNGRFEIISEENENCNEIPIGDYFCIDPIDGTKYYMDDDKYCINIAYIRNNIPVFGLIASPQEDAVYYSSLDGAKKLINGSVAPIYTVQPEDFNKKKQSCTIICNTRGNPKTIQQVENIALKLHQNGHQVDAITQGNAAIKFCKLLDRQADIAVGGENLCDWDIAAPFAILKQCGYIMLDIYGNQIEFSKNIKHATILASARSDLLKSSILS